MSSIGTLNSNQIMTQYGDGGLGSNMVTNEAVNQQMYADLVMK